MWLFHLRSLEITTPNFNSNLLLSDSNPCNTNANYENVIGSCNCKCKEGCTGDGTSCKGKLPVQVTR